MSDPDSPLTPAQDEAVRAHLAAARHTDPVPPDVVARLDATLASLRDEKLSDEKPLADGPAEGAPVVSLASRRRRTLATALLGAAAAVAVAVGLSQVLPGDLGSGSDSSTAAESSAGDSTSSLRESATNDESVPQEDARAYDADRAPKAQRKGQPVPSPAGAAAAAVPELTGAKDLRPQVLPLWRTHLLASSLSSLPAPSCPVAGVANADQRDAVYDGSPATLVFPSGEGGVRRIDIYLCGADEPVRSVHLPVR